MVDEGSETFGTGGSTDLNPPGFPAGPPMAPPAPPTPVPGAPAAPTTPPLAPPPASVLGSSGATGSGSVTGNPGTKMSGLRHPVPLWTLLVTAVLALGLGLAAGGGGDDPEEAASVTASSNEQRSDGNNDSASSTTAPRSTTTRVTTTTTTRPATTTTAAPEAGTRENPFAPGTPLVTTDGVEVSVASVNLDATGAVMAENQFNDPPPDGERYILVSLNVMNGSDEPINPWIKVDVSAIGSANRVHDDCYAVEPDALSDAPELYPGGSASGNVCLVVPSNEVDDGSLLIMVAPMFGDPVFVRP